MWTNRFRVPDVVRDDEAHRPSLEELDRRPSPLHRFLAYLVDVLVVGVPSMFLGVVVPIIPIGLLLWFSYRLACAWFGTSAGRWVVGWRLVRRRELAVPGARGLFHAVLGLMPAVVVVASWSLVMVWLSPGVWWSWLLAALLACVVGIVGALGTLVGLYSGLHARHEPRVDRLAGLRPLLARSMPRLEPER